MRTLGREHIRRASEHIEDAGARRSGVTSSNHQVRPELGGHPGQRLDVGVQPVSGMAEQHPEPAAAPHAIGHGKEAPQPGRMWA